MSIVSYIKSFPIKEFDKGELLLSQGDAPAKLLAIKSGFIKITSLNSDGTQRLLWIAGRYDLAPTESLFSTRGAMKFFYTGFTQGAAYLVDKKLLLDYAKENPVLMREIAKSMSEHYDDLLNRVNTVDQAAVYYKLAHTLHYLAQRFSAGTTVNLHDLGLRLTHQDLADMTGSTRETTTLELQKLRKHNLISYDRNHLIVYVDKIADTIL